MRSQSCKNIQSLWPSWENFSTKVWILAVSFLRDTQQRWYYGRHCTFCTLRFGGPCDARWPGPGESQLLNHDCNNTILYPNNSVYIYRTTYLQQNVTIHRSCRKFYFTSSKTYNLYIVLVSWDYYFYNCPCYCNKVFSLVTLLFSFVVFKCYNSAWSCKWTLTSHYILIIYNIQLVLKL